jgi:hypothetical protein
MSTTTTNSLNSTIKGKSSWETSQTTVSNHNLSNVDMKDSHHLDQINGQSNENDGMKLSSSAHHYQPYRQSGVNQELMSEECFDASTCIQTSNKRKLVDEADIISEIDCDCKASLVHKIKVTQLNRCYD